MSAWTSLEVYARCAHLHTWWKGQENRHDRLVFLAPILPLLSVVFQLISCLDSNFPFFFFFFYVAGSSVCPRRLFLLQRAAFLCATSFFLLFICLRLHHIHWLWPDEDIRLYTRTLVLFVMALGRSLCIGQCFFAMYFLWILPAPFSVCLSVCLSLSLSLSLGVCPSLYLSLCLFLSLSPTSFSPRFLVSK